MLVHISNYMNECPEKMLNNLESLKSTLSTHNVKHFVVKNTEWLDISQFQDNGLTDDVLETVFSKCFINYCHRLHKGILYRCPHQYAGVQLGKLSPKSGQYIDIRSLDSTALADALESFEDLKVLNSCRHCSMAVGPSKVPAGRQIAFSKK